MSTDGDPPTVAGSPEIVRKCADCGEVLPIGGMRRERGHHESPFEPLCVEDYRIAERYCGAGGPILSPLGPPSDTDEDGRLWVRRDCPRCGGKGHVPPFPGVCFGCYELGWTYVCPADVRRTMRWSATFQANRTPHPDPAAGGAPPPPRRNRK